MFLQHPHLFPGWGPATTRSPVFVPCAVTPWAWWGCQIFNFSFGRRISLTQRRGLYIQGLVTRGRDASTHWWISRQSRQHFGGTFF